MSQSHLNECTRIEAGSTDGRKPVAFDDVTKCFLSYKAAILPICLTHLSIGMLSINNISSTYIVLALLWEDGV